MIRRYGYLVIDHCGHHVMCCAGTTADEDLRVAIQHAVKCPKAVLAWDLTQSRTMITYHAPEE